MNKLTDNDLIMIFGSANSTGKLDNQILMNSYELGRMLVQAFPEHYVVTGGGPGVMEKVNEGVSSIDDTKSIGLPIKWTGMDEPANDSAGIHIMCKDFTERKTYLYHESVKAYVVLPGGFGTADELFEAVTLMLTGFIPKKPIIIYDYKGFGQAYLTLFKKMINLGTSSKKWINSIYITDNLVKIVEHLKEKI